MSDRDTNIVGIYGLPRGGTNFIAAALHYHPCLFSVTERRLNHGRPLSRYWDSNSVFRINGRQHKRTEQVKALVFNKVQRNRDLWRPEREFPDGTKFVFYVRNPVRVHLSRESFRCRYEPGRLEWKGIPDNFMPLLTEMKQILDSYESLKGRYPCLLLTHEFFCCEHASTLPQLHAFLGVEPLAPADPRAFFRNCGRCGRTLTVIEHDGQQWLACPRHRRPMMGCGRFNPLRPIDCDGIRSGSWKETRHIEQLMRNVRARLGDAVSDYYWSGDYGRNLFLGDNLASRAA